MNRIHIDTEVIEQIFKDANEQTQSIISLRKYDGEGLFVCEEEIHTKIQGKANHVKNILHGTKDKTAAIEALHQLMGTVAISIASLHEARLVEQANEN